jgi:hypothetical protein
MIRWPGLVSRRGFSRGLGLSLAGTFLAPLYDWLVAEALGATAPTRLIVVSAGAGLLRQDYLPTGGETSFVLPESLKPLEPYRNELLLMESFYNPFNKDLHGNGWATLSMRGSPAQDSGFGSEQGGAYARPGGISFDRFVARKIGAAFPVSSVNLALYGRAERAQLHLSADGPDAVYPAEMNPVRGHANLLGSVSEGSAIDDAAARRARATDARLLAFLKDEAARFRSALAGPERGKAEQILTSIAEYERKLAPVPPGACKATAPLTAAGLDRPSINGDVLKATVEAQVDLLVNALACGRTAVGALSLFANAASHRMWTFLGEEKGGETGVHGHQHRRGASPASAALVVAIQRYQFGLIARIWERLRAIPEAGGTMADNTLLLFANSGGGIHHRGHDAHPMLLLGNPGKRLRTGRWLRLPPKQHSMSDGFVTAARALGLTVDAFGAPEHSRGPVPGTLV